MARLPGGNSKEYFHFWTFKRLAICTKGPRIGIFSLLSSYRLRTAWLEVVESITRELSEYKKKPCNPQSTPFGDSANHLINNISRRLSTSCKAPHFLIFHFRKRIYSIVPYHKTKTEMPSSSCHFYRFFTLSIGCEHQLKPRNLNISRSHWGSICILLRFCNTCRLMTEVFYCITAKILRSMLMPYHSAGEYIFTFSWMVLNFGPAIDTEPLRLN